MLNVGGFTDLKFAKSVKDTSDQKNSSGISSEFQSEKQLTSHHS